MRIRGMDWEFDGELWYWRGPAPWFFVTVPGEVCAEIADEATSVSYGWGMIPVSVELGDTRWNTSLWPKDGRYIVPVKSQVRRDEGVDEGDLVSVRLSLSRS